MIKKFKNKWLLAAMSLFATSSGLLAVVDDAQMRNVENRLSALEQRRGSSAMVNPPGRPQVCDGADIFVTGDVLLWKPSENGIGYAIENNNLSPTPNSGAQVLDPSYKYDWGLRLGLGYNIAHDGWDLYANWTHFNTRVKTSKEVTAGKELFTTYSAPSTQDPITGQSVDRVRSAKNKWKLHLNLIDLELGREFFVSKWMTLRPHVGLRTAWIRQKDEIRYKHAVGDAANFLLSNQTDDIYMLCRFWGIGLRSGLNSKWGLGYGFSIYGNAAVSLLYGYFKNIFNESVNNVAFYNVQDNYRMTRAITDLALGLRWDHHFYDDSFHFGLQAGWEQHIFFGQNQFMHFMTGTNPGVFSNNTGDLTLQGWTLSARFDF